MCGLVGFSGKTPFNKEKINLLMLWNSFERGKDSTGIYTPKNGIIKDITQASKFLIDKTFEEDNIFIGHVRAKTKGANLIKNAHPFLEGNITLAHNGTLKNDYDILKKYDLNHQYHDVDSHVICSVLGKEKNFKVLSEIDGGAAFIILDIENPNTLFVFRNSERPLFKGTYDGNMYISSISESLEMIGCKNIKEFKEQYLYTIINGLIQGNPKKIANKPYYLPKETIDYSNVSKITPNLLFGRLLRFDSYNTPNLTYNKEYFVKGFTQDKIIVEDDNKKDLHAYPSLFDRVGSYFTENDYVESRSNLTDSKNVIVIKKGTICYVTNDENRGEVKVLNLETNRYWSVKNHELKKLSPIKRNAVINDKANKQDGDDFDFYFFNHEFREPEEEDLELKDLVVEDEDNDDEKNEEYYDLSINEDKLINDLSNIEIGVKDLEKVVDAFVPDNFKEEYQTKKDELNEVLNEVLESYNVTNKI